MKVYMGKYPTWVGPYQIAEKIMFWRDKDDDAVHKLGEWLAGKDDHVTWLSKFCQWYRKKFQRNGNRKVTVRIDNTDVWSMSDTLALIIAPMLRKLRDCKHGSPLVDDTDVPERLRSTAAPVLSQDQIDCGHTDDLFHERWTWVIDEMIWAFEQLEQGDWDDQYHTGVIDFKSVPIDKDGNELPEDRKDEATWFRMDHGPKHTSKFDKAGHDAHAARIQNGLSLFGKYYQALWD
jgi:hypothetical protein